MHDLRRDKSQLKMDKETIQQENNILKARIASLEVECQLKLKNLFIKMNGEFVKQMSSQRESMLKEISILHEANEKLTLEKTNLI